MTPPFRERFRTGDHPASPVSAFPRPRILCLGGVGSPGQATERAPLSSAAQSWGSPCVGVQSQQPLTSARPLRPGYAQAPTAGPDPWGPVLHSSAPDLDAALSTLSGQVTVGEGLASSCPCSGPLLRTPH